MRVFGVLALMARGADDDSDIDDGNPSNSSKVEACVLFDFRDGGWVRSVLLLRSVVVHEHLPKEKELVADAVGDDW